MFKNVKILKIDFGSVRSAPERVHVGISSGIGRHGCSFAHLPPAVEASVFASALTSF